MGLSIGFGLGPIRFRARMPRSRWRRRRRRPARRRPVARRRSSQRPAGRSTSSSARAGGVPTWVKVIGVLVILGLVVQYWYVFVALAVLGGVGYLIWRSQSMKAAQAEANRTAQRIAELQARQQAYSYLTPEDVAWLRAHL